MPSEPAARSGPPAQPPRKRTAVLISGRGSNMMALAEAARASDFPAEIAQVISNRPDAAGLAWAKNRGIPAKAIDHKMFPSRESFEAELQASLAAAGIELIACAGFMRILTGGFVGNWRGRMINIHPSLLPSYKGLHTHERALADGVKISGCTIHFVSAEMDAGPIIAQAAVQVLEGDTAEDLAARVLAAEHVLYPRALALVASGQARISGNCVTIDAKINQAPPLLSTGP